MKKLLSAVIFGFLAVVFSSFFQPVILAAEQNYLPKPGMFGIAITYDGNSQTPEYKYIRRTFKYELSKVLSGRELDLPEKIFKVRIKESLDDPQIGEPAILVLLNDDPICWVKISQLGTPEQMRGFSRFASELIFRRLKQLSGTEVDGNTPLFGNKPKKANL